MKKHFRILFSLCLFLFLTAQNCIPNALGLGNDCTGIQLNTLTQDANGNVTVIWTNTSFSPPTITVSTYASDTGGVSEIVFTQDYAANTTIASFRIDWRSLSVNKLHFIFQTISCTIVRDLTRPTAATATPSARATSTSVPNIAAASMNCANLRLTSPLGGMANGMQTFYWDALPNAIAYRINIYYAGNLLAGWAAPTGQLNLTADVSIAAIGGETPLTVELVAFDGRDGSCTKHYDMGREAAPAQQGPAPTTTCVPNPNPTGPRCI